MPAGDPGQVVAEPEHVVGPAGERLLRVPGGEKPVDGDERQARGGRVGARIFEADRRQVEAAGDVRLRLDAVQVRGRTLIMFDLMIQVSEPMMSCSVATAVLPAGEKFDPPSGLTLSVCAYM